jgi:hypothetical protein
MLWRFGGSGCYYHNWGLVTESLAYLSSMMYR